VVRDRSDLVAYVHQPNQGVAHARNAGVEGIHTKYICCLDSDDSIEPGFLETCVNALEMDPALGIAYTKLTMRTPEGTLIKPTDRGGAKWPDGYDFARQLKRGNQVPTCCVFRRVAWERTGGYRQRYAPKGAGAEDGELWLRMGALGFGGQLVTQEPLFVYSVGTGIVSGDPNYQEVDYLAWHPWTKDGQHPLGSMAAPKFLSHPVRQYDDPTVSVIIPVGPGHAQHLWNALDSLEAQSFRKWEAIVVWDSFDEDITSLESAYPFVRWGSTGKEGSGAGAARNIGLEMARGPFSIFLDADDWLYPEYIEKVLKEWNDGDPAIIYTDYVGKAIVTDPSKLAPDLQSRIYYREEDTNLTVIGWKSADWDCDRAQRQPEGNNPWLWANVTCLIPTLWARQVGFDESLPSWEDALFHYKLSRAGKCYRRLPEELYVYCLHYGRRRDEGGQIYESLLQSIRQLLETEEIMPCPGGCGGRTRQVPTPTVSPLQAQSNVPENEDFVLVTYMHPNRGDHGVIGGNIFTAPIAGVSMIPTREGYRINYGHQPGGGQVRFRVHRRDMAVNPYFVPAQTTEVRGVIPTPVPPPAPVQTTEPPPVMSDTLNAPPVPRATPPPKVLEMEIEGQVEQVAVPHQGEALDAILMDLQLVPGIGPATAKVLVGQGINSPSDILTLGIPGLTQIPGVSEVKAEGIIAFVKSKNDAAQESLQGDGQKGGVLSLEDLTQ
jgi:glycosyltransferase involved in cell wall biosynthesis